MNPETEILIVRAAQMRAYGFSSREVFEAFVAEGVDPETAYLITKAGKIFERGRRRNPTRSWSRFAWSV